MPSNIMTNNTADISNGYLGRLGRLASRLLSRRERGPIDSLSAMNGFVSTRAAYIAQKTLYGYLKTRIGTRYPKVVEDEAFVESVNIAKMNVFAACVSDLAVYAVGRALRDVDLPDRDRRMIALECFDRALAANAAQITSVFDPNEPRADFLLRMDGTDWAHGAYQRENFTRSPSALVRWAPIAPELKKFDAEIVENSVKFAWNEIRLDYERRLDAQSVAADVLANARSTT